MKSILLTAGMAASLIGSAAAHAALIDLETWTAESYPDLPGFPPASWELDADATSATQTANAQPSVFYSDFSALGTEIQAEVHVTPSLGTDDDFIGFVLGFRPGDTTSALADYLLIDWKRQAEEPVAFLPQDDPQGPSSFGLAVSRVQGTPTADEFFQHATLSSPGGGVTELQSAATLGSTGWDYFTTYEFAFDFGPNHLDVYVDGVLELDIDGSFSDGRFGFYSFNQGGASFSAWQAAAPVTPVPGPGTLVLFTAGLLAVAVRKHRVCSSSDI